MSNETNSYIVNDNLIFHLNYLLGGGICYRFVNK
jgi:hypothetical protein